MGCMEDGLSVWVGCEHWEMTPLFAKFERRCIHEGKEGKEAVVFLRLAEEARTGMSRRRERGWRGRSVRSRGGQPDLETERRIGKKGEIFGVWKNSERGLFLLLVASFYFRCD